VDILLSSLLLAKTLAASGWKKQDIKTFIAQNGG
jgi:hypothetical protein